MENYELLLKDTRGDGELRDLLEKALGGEELNLREGTNLLKSNDLYALGFVADQLRRKAVGDIVTFVINRHINYTNVCVSKCKFCAFYREPQDKEAYTLSLEEIIKKVSESMALGITELHIVGSLNPELPFDYYESMLRGIKTKYPRIHIQGFTAVEIAYFAKLFGNTIKETLSRLIDAGLDSMPGGGAEVFSEKLRSKLCPNKVTGKDWLRVHEIAHRLGLRTNATMLYGHIESLRDRVEHLIKLRKAQKKTGGFQAFIPLSFHHQNTEIYQKGMVQHGPSGFDDLKTLAISRIMLNNIPNIRAFWVMTGKKLAQISLHYGVNDLDGTVVEERITHSAGATTGEYMAKEEIFDLIKRAGRVPAQRNTLHEIIQVYGQ